jgi:predicted ATP-dependent serine protease
VGLEQNRLAMLLAVLPARGCGVFDQDVFVSTSGRMKIDSPPPTSYSAGYRVVAQKQALPAKLVVFGEVGLAGSAACTGGSNYARQQLNFTRALIPRANA